VTDYFDEASPAHINKTIHHLRFELSELPHWSFWTMTLSSQSSLARDKNETLLSSMKFDSALPGATKICDGMGRTRRSDVSLRQTTQRQSGALLATMNNEVIDLQAKEIAQLRSRVAELERLRSESASLDFARSSTGN